MPAKDVWIVVADGKQAKLFAIDPAGRNLRPIAEPIENETLPSRGRDLTTDRPGRSNRSAGGRKYALEPRVDVRRLEKERFAQRIADILAAGARKQELDSLIVIAAPRFLGDLRRAIAKGPDIRLMGQFAKDLLKLPVRSLAAQIRTLARDARLAGAAAGSSVKARSRRSSS